MQNSVPRISQTRKNLSHRKKTLKRGVQIPKLYNGLSGFGIDKEKYPEHKTTYGEILPESIPVLYEIFSKYAPLNKISQPYRNFYDIGCGIGKVVIGMASQHSFLKCNGIEVVPERIIQANTALQRISDESLRKRIEFLCISMLDDSVNYTNACWIFISNLCFEKEINEKLFEKLSNEVKSGCVVVCSKEHNNSTFEKLNHMSLPMSWSDQAKVFIYKKK
jgi:Histone methylation protein DOT1